MANGTGQDLSGMSMRDLFRMEAESQTSILAQGLLELEKNNNSTENLESLMRASHSVKGAARIVGIDAVVAIAHELEDCFVAAQQRKIQLSSAHIDLLLEAVDTIVKIAHLDDEQTRQWLRKNNKQIDELQGNLKSILSGKQITRNNISAEKKSVNKVVEQQTPSEVTVEQFSGSKQIVESIPQDVNDNASIDERVIRINADRLTRIMGLSSEIMVESGWLRPFTDSMVLLKRRHAEMSNLLDSVRESIEQTVVSESTRIQLVDAMKKLSDCRSMLSERLADLDDYDRRNSKLSSKIYNEVVATRMRPFSDGVQALPRMVRDVSRKLKKKVKLDVEGKNTPVDRDILENIKSPLMHLVRNAIDHGIETPKNRKAAGKPEEGTLKITASHAGGMLAIIVEDDGQGIDLDKLRKKIISKKLASKEIVSSLSNSELFEFLFLPNFSTKSRVTEISGRGVGLDVVRNHVQEMHGNVSIDNNISNGLRFTLQLPLTLSVVTALKVEISGEYYAFPLSRVDRLLSITQEQISTVEGRQYIKVDDELVGLIPAFHVLELETTAQHYDEYHVVVVSDRLSRYGVVVDRFIGQRKLSVQALDARLGKVQDISAAALSSDGQPVLIIDVDDLVRSIDAITNGGTGGVLKPFAEIMTHKVRKRILVVDDSLTVREIERKLLESYGYRVDVAVDGMDGWNAVRRTKYNLIITDVDMPRMDGIELVKSMKDDHHLKKLPIMIVSYKDRHEDRQRGLEAGADYYLTKGSFHDETLIEAVVDLIGEASE